VAEVKGYGLPDIVAVAAELDSATGTTRAGPQRRRIWAARIERAVEEIEPQLDALAKVRALHAPQKTDRDPLTGDGEGPLVCGICTPVGRFGAYVGEWPCETAVIVGVEEEE
jgi:hypothetical protein